jgi:hypothetical protein
LEREGIAAMIKRILAALFGMLLLFGSLYAAALSALGIYQQYWQLPRLAARMGTTVVSRHSPAEIAMMVLAWVILIGIILLSIKLLLYSARKQPATQI